MTEHTTTADAPGVIVSTQGLVEALAKVAPAAAASGTDPVGRAMAHVHGMTAGRWLHLMAGDNHRIHYARVPLAESVETQSLAVPVALGKQLRAMGLHTAKAAAPVTLAGAGCAGLSVRVSGGFRRDYPVIFPLGEFQKVAQAGRSMWCSLSEALAEANHGEPRGENKVSPVFLAQALRAAQGGDRAVLAQAHLQSLRSHRLLVSAPAGSAHGFRAVIMGQRNPAGPAPLRDEHQELRAAFPRPSEID